MSEIAILVPVLGRPGSAQALLDSAFRAATVDTQILFVCSPHDTEQIAACEKLRRAFTDGSLDVLIGEEWGDGRGDYARKINAGFRATTAPFVFTGADDIRFQPGWDKHALMVGQAASCGVVGTDDLCNPRTRMARRHSTHSLVKRSYVDEQQGGIVLHDGYWHNYVDDELVQTALARHAYRPSRAQVRHLHPMHNRQVRMDETYRIGQARFDEDRQLFLSRQHLWRRTAPRRRQR